MVDLYSKFENLPEHKKNRIIDVCLEEFAQNGYENASTNNIVKNAGISKGILFHYFGNKKNLYTYILNYTLDFTMNYISQKSEKIKTNPRADIFEKIMNTGLIKLKMAYEFPSMYKFLFNAFIRTPGDLKKEIQDSYDRIIQTGMSMFFNDIDTSRFRKDIDPDRAIELVYFALEGVGNKYLKKYKGADLESMLSDTDKILKEYEEYIDILKHGVYENTAE